MIFENSKILKMHSGNLFQISLSNMWLLVLIESTKFCHAQLWICFEEVQTNVRDEIGCFISRLDEIFNSFSYPNKLSSWYLFTISNNIANLAWIKCLFRMNHLGRFSEPIEWMRILKFSKVESKYCCGFYWVPLLLK